MPRFYTHLRTSEGLEQDEIGTEYPSLEVAYLNACEGIPRLAAEMMQEGHDPSAYIFKIKDGADQLLMEVPFVERVTEGRRVPQREPVRIEPQAQALLNRLDLLTLSIRDEMTKLRANLAQAHEEVSSIQAARVQDHEVNEWFRGSLTRL